MVVKGREAKICVRAHGFGGLRRSRVKEQDRDLRAEKISDEHRDAEADYAHPWGRSLGAK
jgi:hypothetical protein